jgi:hypothetical protein
MKIRHKKIHPDKILIAELYLKIEELKDLIAKIAPYIWYDEFELIEEANQALKE